MLAAVVLAAGQGKRMKSDIPKVLHRLCGRPMIHYVLEAVEGVGPSLTVVVVGFGGEMVAGAVKGRAEVVYQQEQLGTAHALLQAAPLLAGFDGHILVTCGDTPLLTAATLRRLVEAHLAAGARATLLTAVLEDPTGYGRVVRDEAGRVRKIVEQKDATLAELGIREVNTGVYCFAAAGLFEALATLGRENAQGEYYLTDLVESYVSRGFAVAAVAAEDPREVEGVNDRVQLARAESFMRRRILEELMLSGVTVVDPATTFVDRGVRVGRDTVIYPFTFIEGDTVIGTRCTIGPGARLINARVGDGAVIQQAVVEESEVGDGCAVGPYAYVRPGCLLAPGVKVGSFVELKKALVGRGSKIPHLSYVGDASVGEGVNIGAGTITCNFDGERKWHTEIGDGAFIGSNANLVAPVKIGAGAYIGAGSTITRDVPPGALGVARGRQKNIPDWSARKKKRPDAGHEG